MRPPKMTIGPVCFWLPRFLPGVGAYFNIVGTSERLPTRTTSDEWSGTLGGSSVESMWRVDQVFPYRVYIHSNRRDSRI
jgi:hypothetical protein